MSQIRLLTYTRSCWTGKRFRSPHLRNLKKKKLPFPESEHLVQSVINCVHIISTLHVTIRLLTYTRSCWTGKRFRSPHLRNLKKKKLPFPESEHLVQSVINCVHIISTLHVTIRLLTYTSTYTNICWTLNITIN